MKVSHAESHVLSSEGLEQKQVFKIRTSAHAFKILSSGLYSDKVGAVLREIGCNAHDAHIAAGKSHLPIEVKLPNAIDPQFWIRDWGTGLSHEEVMNLYTTYFASTKQDSNDFTGAFGLGSKSPFSYTDSFTITSCHGGMSRIYSAHIDNTGSPNIALMSEVELKPTVVFAGNADGTDIITEPRSGITISFPVKPSDFSAFKVKAQEIFQYFNPLPTILGSEQIKPLKVIQDFGSYAFIDEVYGVRVQMGNVCYPVNLQDLNINMYSPDSLDANVLHMRGVLLRLAMGDVQVAASREKIQYDPVSQTKIKDSLRKVIFNVCKEVEKLWLQQTTSGTWADICKFHELKKNSNRGFYLDDKIYKAAGIAKYNELAEACNQSSIRLPENLVIGAKYSLVEMNDYRKTVTRGKPKEHCAFVNDILLVHGTDTYHFTRIKDALKNGTVTGRVLLVSPDHKEKGKQAEVDRLVAQLRSTFKGVPEKKLSEFPAPPKVARVKVPKGSLRPLPADLAASSKVYINEQGKSSWGRSQTRWWFSDGCTMDWYERQRLEQQLAIIEPIIKFIDPIPLTKAKIRQYKLKERPDWKDYKTYMAEAMATPTAIAALKKEAGNFKPRIELNSYRSATQTGLLGNLVHLKEYHPAIFSAFAPVLTKFKILDIINEIHKNSKTDTTRKPQKILSAYKAVADSLNILIAVPEFDEHQIKLDETYPAASEIPYSFFLSLGTHSPKLLPVFLEEVINKDVVPVTPPTP